jgi:hypothetical protein
MKGTARLLALLATWLGPIAQATPTVLVSEKGSILLPELDAGALYYFLCQGAGDGMRCALSAVDRATHEKRVLARDLGRPRSLVVGMWDLAWGPRAR